MKINKTFFAFIAVVNVAVAEPVTDCDRYATHPLDPDKVTAGVDTADVVTHVAIPACRRAIEEDPDNPRLHYQLGRSLYYWAEGNGADTSEAVSHVKQAADMGHTQAMFVLGLLYRYGGDVCSSEPLTKDAANNGLKSARITYVNLAVSGQLDPCVADIDVALLRQYVDAAGTQVEGYYEEMLLQNLSRQVDNLAE